MRDYIAFEYFKGNFQNVGGNDSVQLDLGTREILNTITHAPEIIYKSRLPEAIHMQELK